MSVVQYKKYFWLVDTIRSAGKITKSIRRQEATGGNNHRRDNRSKEHKR